MVRINGQAQAVNNFKVRVEEMADELELTGWICDVGWGFTELLVGGEGPAVDFFIRGCRKSLRNTDLAVVEKREATEEELQSLPAHGFKIRR